MTELPERERPQSSRMSIERRISSKGSAEKAGKSELPMDRHAKNSVSREVGSMGVWSLSSCKPGFGVDQLRDNSRETYWQSDGPQPHLVNIEFKEKTQIENVCIYVDYKLDESYTPQRISVRVGNHFHDLQEVGRIELHEPEGWVLIPLREHKTQIRAFLVQIAVLTNHQNGKDTHIRQIKVHSPTQTAPVAMLDLPFDYTSIEFKQHAAIR